MQGASPLSKEREEIKAVVAQEMGLETLSLKKLNGLSNNVYLVSTPERPLIVKKLSKVNLFTRFERTHLSKFLQEKGLIHFEMGCFRIERYIPNREVTLEEAQKSSSRCLMTRALVKFNQLQSSPRKSYHANYLLQEFGEEIRERVSRNIAETEPAQQEVLNNLLAKALDIIRTYQAPDEELVMSHNDYYYRNVLFNTTEGHYELIDFEYSHFNPRGYDLANFMNELLVDYNHPDFPFFKFNPAALPSAQEARELIRFYLFFEKHPNLFANESDSDALFEKIKASHEYRDIPEAEVQNICERLRDFFVVINAFWLVWALFYFYNPNIDFSYVDFAILKGEMIENFLAKKNFEDTFAS